MKSMFKGIKPIAFFPPFLLLLTALVMSFLDMDGFVNVMTGANNWLFLNLGWLFQFGSVSTVILCIFIMFSPFGNIRIGGSKAKPILSPFKWWAVSLCVTIAVGILFWACCEPMFYLNAPPESLHIAPNSPEAAVFAMSTEFFHWGFTMYAIYTVPALMFAFAYYNMRRPYGFSSTLFPILGERSTGKIGDSVDGICIFVLVAGMAVSLGQGILSMTGGLESLFGIPKGPFMWLIVDIVIVVTFLASSLTGITKGIKWLSDFNAKVFFALLLYMVIVGPTAYCLNLGAEGMGNLLTHFFEKSLFTGASSGDTWPQSWTIWVFAVAFAWTPVMAVFLGQIGVGYKVRHFILVNFVTPAVFGIFWMTIFGGGAIHMELVQKLGIENVVLTEGAEMGTYFFLEHIPLGTIIIPIYLLIMFLSFVTGSDAMATSMGGICSTGISPESPEPKKWLKIVWGVLLGGVAFIMVSFDGISGIKTLGTFGGFPAMLLELGVMVGLIFVVMNPQKYDVHKEDYNEDGSYKRLARVDSKESD